MTEFGHLNALGPDTVPNAGCVFTVPLEEIERLITDAGYVAKRRNTRYELV